MTKNLRLIFSLSSGRRCRRPSVREPPPPPLMRSKKSAGGRTLLTTHHLESVILCIIFLVLGIFLFVGFGFLSQRWIGQDLHIKASIGSLGAGRVRGGALVVSEKIQNPHYLDKPKVCFDSVSNHQLFLHTHSSLARFSVECSHKLSSKKKDAILEDNATRKSR